MSKADESTVRSRILRAALEVIGRDGPAGFTNRAVAATAGVSLGSLTYHFDSQQTLLREALELFLDEEVKQLEALNDRIAAASLTLGEAGETLEALLRTGDDRRAAKMQLYLEAARNRALRPAAIRCFETYDRLAATALGALGIDDPNGLAPILVAILDGLQLRRLASGERELRLAPAIERVLGGLRDSASGPPHE